MIMFSGYELLKQHGLLQPSEKGYDVANLFQPKLFDNFSFSYSTQPCQLTLLCGLS